MRKQQFAIARKKTPQPRGRHVDRSAAVGDRAVDIVVVVETAEIPRGIVEYRSAEETGRHREGFLPHRQHSHLRLAADRESWEDLLACAWVLRARIDCAQRG